MSTELNSAQQPVKEVINVEMTKDKMLGVIWFEQAQNDGALLSEQEIRSAISSRGITMGINEALIEEIVKERKYEYKYIVAQGKQPVNGEDGSIKLAFDAQSLKEFKPRLNDDGTVDLKDLSAVRNVNKGDLLATKIPATVGEDGYNISGQVLKSKRGKEARIPKGKNTILLQDGISLVADIDGKLEYDDHNVYVNAVYTLQGDVDTGVGNIDFIGSVVINGSIHTGYTVKARGSVEVKGSVDDAVIIAGGDVLLSYGMQGTEKCRIVSKGNVVAKFLQNVNVEADGNVITESILHSNISAGQSIRAEMGKGTIVGGSVAATDMIVARSIGSPMGTATAVQIGVPPTVYQEHKQLGQELKIKAECLNKVDQSIRFLFAKSQNGKLDEQKQVMLHKLNATRKPLVEEYEEIEARCNSISKRLREVKDGIIQVADVIYSGVRIEIGSSIKYIDDKIVRCVIRRQDGDIYIDL